MNAFRCMNSGLKVKCVMMCLRIFLTFLLKRDIFFHYSLTFSSSFEQRPPSAPRPKSATFLRAHSRTGPSIKNISRPCTPDPPSEKLTVPPARCSSEVGTVSDKIWVMMQSSYHFMNQKK